MKCVYRIVHRVHFALQKLLAQNLEIARRLGKRRRVLVSEFRREWRFVRAINCAPLRPAVT